MARSLIGDGIERMPKNAEHPYTKISNEVLHNNTLTLEAKGLLCYLLSKPDNWVVRINDLVRSHPEGKTKTQRIVRELEEKGYLIRELSHKDGKYYWHTMVYESPSLNPWRPE